MSSIRGSTIRKQSPNFKSPSMRENVCILLLAILCIIYPGKADSDVNIMASVCYPGTFVNEFVYTEPVKCINNPPGSTVKCTAVISQPRAEEIEVKAYVCFKTIEGWQSYVSFFGGREKTELDPTQQSVEINECRDMINGKYNQAFGEMIPNEAGDIIRTQNKRKIRYAWNQNLAGETENRVLMKTTIMYNFHDDEMISSLSMMHECAIRKGFCSVDKYTYIWDTTTVPLCYPAPFYN